jgi:hypothetical protein
MQPEQNRVEKFISFGCPVSERADPQHGRITRLFHFEEGWSGSMQMEQIGSESSVLLL